MIGASAANVKAEEFSKAIDARLSWLAPDAPAPDAGRYSQADLNTFAALGFKPPGRG